MPLEPPPTPWALSRPPDDHPHDAWAFGADLAPGTVLCAYRLGVFPMRVEGDLLWWSPARRAVIPVAGFAASRSLRRAARGYEIKVDRAFADVIQGCSDPARPHGWIDQSFVDGYSELHRLGWVHSVEAWDDDGLAGGLYGVGIGGLFAAESKFHRRPGASKAALLALILRMEAAGGPRLLDVQWMTPHLRSLGAVEVTRAEYRVLLDEAICSPDMFGQLVGQDTSRLDGASAQCGTGPGRRLRQAADVVREPDHEQHQHEPDADDRDALVDTPGDRPSARALDDRKDDVPTVEREERQEVEQRNRE